MLLLSDFYKTIFNEKTYKLSLDASCTCPNRDGTKGSGGCIFCSESGSGDFASSCKKTVSEQVEEAKLRVEKKLRGRSGKRAGKYIAYFQNFTSTYGNARVLEAKYLEALGCKDVAGISIATRPDCIFDDILSTIKKISQRYFVQIELGLQTSNEQTGKLINRCYTNEDYINAVKKIKSTNPHIHIVSHLIFGLPGETEGDMMKSIDFVSSVNNSAITGLRADRDADDFLFGIKITSLYVVRGTKLSEMYKNGEYKALSKEKYLELLDMALKRLPKNTVIHRLTGDPPKALLISPEWPEDKKRVMNDVMSVLKNYLP